MSHRDPFFEGKSFSPYELAFLKRLVNCPLKKNSLFDFCPNIYTFPVTFPPPPTVIINRDIKEGEYKK